MNKLFVLGISSLFSISTQAQLSGSFTIDPDLPASSTNYLNFESVTGDLKDGTRIDGGTANGPGVSAAVDISVASGTYEESVELEKYDGASDVNRITFHSEAEDSTAVLVLFETVVLGPGTLPLYMNGAQYIDIRHLSFQNTGASYAKVVDIRKSASYNNFIGNRFIGADALYESDITDFGVVNFVNTGCFGGCPSPGYCEDNVFEGNLMLNGSRSVLLQRQGFAETTAPRGTVFRNNVMQDFMNQGMSITETEDLLIQGNDIFQRDSATDANGIYLLSFDESDVRILDNDIRLNVNQENDGEQICFGIVVSGDTDAASAEDSLIIQNNFISVQSVGTTYGIIIFDMQYMEVVVNNNSVRTIPSEDVTTNCGLCFGAETILRDNLTLFNNNVQCENFGIPVVISETDMIANMDYNNIYSSVDTLVGTGLTATDFYYGNAPDDGYLDIPAWNVASTYDANSISVNPEFISEVDLHTTNCALVQAGTPIASVTHDIDGELRLDPPTIGADEIEEGYIPMSVEASICEGETFEFGGELYDEAGTYEYEALGIDDCDTLYTLTLLVNPIPEVDLGEDLTVCLSDGEVTFDAGGGDLDYDWNTGETTQTIDLLPLEVGEGEHDYEVLVSDENGCENSDVVLLIIHALPEVDLGMDIDLCKDAETLTLDAGEDGEAYDWNTGDTDQMIEVNPLDLEAGMYEYMVEVINEFDCSATDEIMVTINDLPMVDLGADFDICDTASAFSLDAGEGFDYDWSTGSMDQIIMVDPSDLELGTNSFDVMITDENECTNTDEIVITVIDCIGVGVDENGTLISFAIYPNPVTNAFTIQMRNGSVEMPLTMYDASGKKVLTAQLNSEKTVISTVDLARGVYFVHVNSEILKIIVNE